MKIKIKIHTFDTGFHILYDNNGKPIILYVGESYGYCDRLEKYCDISVKPEIEKRVIDIISYFYNEYKYNCPELEKYLERDM